MANEWDWLSELVYVFSQTQSLLSCQCKEQVRLSFGRRCPGKVTSSINVGWIRRHPNQSISHAQVNVLVEKRKQEKLYVCSGVLLARARIRPWKSSILFEHTPLFCVRPFIDRSQLDTGARLQQESR